MVSIKMIVDMNIDVIIKFKGWFNEELVIGWM